MTLVTGVITDVTGVPDLSQWTFSSVMREDSTGSAVVTTKRVNAKPNSSGVLSVNVDPGIVIISYRGRAYTVEVPAIGPVDVWGLIAAEVADLGSLGDAALGAAVEAYLDANPQPLEPAGFQRATGRTVLMAHELGTAFKSSTAPAGEKPIVIAEHYGSGLLEQIWYAADVQGVTTRDTLIEDNGIIRIYIDNSSTPTVSMSVNDFFMYGARGGAFTTEVVGRSARMGGQSSAYRNMYAPYKAYMRVELLNTSATDQSAVYTTVQYREDSSTTSFGQYKIFSTKNLSIAKYAELTVCDFDGSGQVESVYISVDSATAAEFGFLEGNPQIFVDNEPVAAVQSSGIEDFFQGGWYQIPVGGYPTGQAAPSDLAGTHVALYRFFPKDPIRFNTHLKVVFPVGQRAQGSITPATLAVGASVGVWLDTPAIPSVSGKVNRAAPILEDDLNYTGALSSAVWNQVGGVTAASGSGSSITFPYSTAPAGQDMRAARKGVTLPSNYWVETKVRITGANDDRTCGLIVTGLSPDPYYGSGNHIDLKRVAQYQWQIVVRDGFDTVSVTDLGSGRDLTNQYVWLAIKVQGTKRTAYYRFDGALDWHPVVSWTANHAEGSAFGIGSWQAGCEFDALNVYALN